MGKIDFSEKVEQFLRNKQDNSSHRELNPEVFHPSYMGNCKRQLVVSKLGLSDPDVDSLGYFEAGTVIHSWFENRVSDVLPGWVEQEIGVEREEDGFRLVGHADAVDFANRVVYDFKSRSGWFKFDEGGHQKYKDQVLSYIWALAGMTGTDPSEWSGRLVFVNKKCLSDVRQVDVEWSSGRWAELREKASWVTDFVSDYVGESSDGRWIWSCEWEDVELPGKCGECYPCKKVERLVKPLRDRE